MYTEEIYVKVFEGKSGYLFLDNDTNSVIRQITGEMPIPEAQKKDIKITLESRIKISKVFGFKYLFLITPNTHCVQSEYLPETIHISENRSAVYLAKTFPNIVFYPLQLLREYRDAGYTVSRKTDTHWSKTGAAIVYNKVAEILELNNKINIDEHSEIMFMGDLGEKCDPHQSETYEELAFRGEYQVVFSNGIGGTGGYVHIKTKNESGVKAVIFGFSSTYRFFDVISFYFSEIYFFCGGIFDVSLISKIHPDVVISQMSERFFNGIFDERTHCETILHKFLSPGCSDVDTLRHINLSDGIYSDSFKELLEPHIEKLRFYPHKKGDYYLGKIVGSYISVENGIEGWLDHCYVDENECLCCLGWSHWTIDDAKFGKRIFIIGNGELDYVVFDARHVVRYDAYRVFHNKDYLWSGFECRIPLDDIASYSQIHIYIGYISKIKVYIKEIIKFDTKDIKGIEFTGVNIG